MQKLDRLNCDLGRLETAGAQGLEPRTLRVHADKRGSDPAEYFVRRGVRRATYFPRGIGLRVVGRLTTWATLFLALYVGGWELTRTAECQEWTRFRGPNGSGQSETVLPASWNPSEFRWKTSLPGEGHSSPVLWGKRLFVLSADRQTATRYALCLDADTGRILWRRDYPSVPHTLHVRSSYASATPAVDAERVYFAWSEPNETTLLALDHEGVEVWRLNLGKWVSQHGFGTSPMVYNGIVYLNNSQDSEEQQKGKAAGESFLMAFDCRTGRELWRTPRKSDAVSYSVPCVFQPPQGEPQLICLSTPEGVYSVDPQTGRENWSVPEAFTMRTVSSPVIVGDLIFGTTGSGGGGNYVVAVRSDGTKAQIAYQYRKQAPYVPTPIAYGDAIFLWSDGGVVTCLDAKTGAVHFAERVHDGGFSGSPIRAGDKIYCISDDGTLVAIAADTRQLRLLGKTPLGEMSRATPAVSGGRMYVRTLSHVICLASPSS